MRTVLTLDEDAADILRSHAEKRGVSLGIAASELIRKGSRDRTQQRVGIPARKAGSRPGEGSTPTVPPR